MNTTRDLGRPEEAAAVLERFRAQMLVTARRYSADHHDAEDAFQRTAEIVLRRSLTGTDDELRRWLRTTIKREALAIRHHRERATPACGEGFAFEPADDGPDAHEAAERSERLHLGTQALGRLKPHEIRCLVLKAKGYSYEEICAATDWSYTKVNRCLTEGRRAFLAEVRNIESGAECERIAPHLSALADGEATATDLSAVRPHLKTCLSCRARLREYRAVPARVAALAPPAALAVSGSDGGPVRGFFESLAGATQHKTAALGERAHQAAELLTGQKAAAVAASAAALAGGGAVTADHLRERSLAERPAETRRAAQKSDTPPPPPADTTAPPAALDAPPQTPTAAPTPAPPAPVRNQAPQQRPAPAPPRPSNEFAPEAAAASPAPAPAPAPSPAPAPAPAGAGNGGGGGGGEFSP